MSLFAHILIGCPGSGKSTFARELLNYDSSCRLVSTDRIREQLFGCQSIQGDWSLVAQEVRSQIELYLKLGHSIVYDATNAKGQWRKEFLENLKDNSVLPIGWHLQTPLKVCLAWNRQRLYQVPDLIVENYYQMLQEFPPTEKEGFNQVSSIPYKDGSLDYNLMYQMLCALTK